jgi:hypothetical protein
MTNITIISGGQSGVDRGALEAAVAAAVAYGGWCPLDGWAEDAPAAPGVRGRYPHLEETPSREPRQRTAWNVRDSDAVLALVDRRGLAVSAGTRLAIELAADYGKPCLCLDLEVPASLPRATAWLDALPRQLRLNVVGPRESEAPGIGAATRRFVAELLVWCASRT